MDVFNKLVTIRHQVRSIRDNGSEVIDQLSDGDLSGIDQELIDTITLLIPLCTQYDELCDKVGLWSID